MSGENAQMACPTFQKQEPVIQDITDRINKANDVREKAELARKLQEEVDVLWFCPDCDEEDSGCNICRIIANAREKTAGLIIDAEKLV